jgi:DNA polymerase-1
MPTILDTAELNFDALSADENHWVYNGLDCCVTHEIFTELRSQADNVALATYEFSKALQAPILEMNMRGLLVNKRRKSKVVYDIKRKMERLEEQFNYLVREGVGVEPINWRSPAQLKNLLYGVMQLPEQKKITNGVWSTTTDEEALEKLSNYFIAEPLCNHLLLLRGLGKSLGFLETNIDPDGRMRTQFKIAGTNTGRFASSVTDFGTGTNLQNVTSSLRSIFVADPGMMFCNIDLEQADSRNVGALCWEALLDRSDWNEQTAGAYLDACESGDLHTYVSKIAYPDLPWGTAPDREIAERLAYKHYDYRYLSKKCGHGSNYLATPPTVAKHARISRKVAEEFQAKYFSAFPCIPAWHDTIFKELETLGYLQTPFGRRRFFFGRPKEGATRREAVAFTPQSMTADEINRGILNLGRGEGVHLLVHVHDSILFQFPEHLRDEIVPWALETIKVALPLKRGRELVVPTDAETGWNWGKWNKDDPGENPDGLKKWKGGDDRKREETKFQLSLADF